MYFFRNDYSEGAHPAIFDALAATNLESTVGYGRDPYCAEAIEAVRRRFACPEAVLTGVETRSSSHRSGALPVGGCHRRRNGAHRRA